MNPKYYDRIQEIGQVVRFHTFPGPVQQTIAAHSWGVAWIITEFHPSPSIVLIRAALEHDLEEHLTSDVSYYSKALYPPLKEAMEHTAAEARKELGIKSVDSLGEEDEWWLKMADLLEGALWSKHLTEEYSSRQYQRTWSNYSSALEKHTSKNAPESFTTNAMLKMFIRSTQPRGVI